MLIYFYDVMTIEHDRQNLIKYMVISFMQQQQIDYFLIAARKIQLSTCFHNINGL